MFTVQTEWDCPEEFPDLSGARYIAIDLETKDLDLKARGSGAIHDYLINNTKYKSPFKGKEFRLLDDPDGILNLYYNMKLLLQKYI